MGAVCSLFLFDKYSGEEESAIVDLQSGRTVQSSFGSDLRHRVPENVAEEENGGALYL